MNLQAILDFLAQPGVRWALSIAGGYLMKKHPSFVTKAVPVLLMIGNVVVLLVDELFGTKPAAVNAGFVAVLFTQAGLLHGAAGVILNPITEAAMTVFLGSAVGTHSTIKNLFQWIKAGAGLLVAKGDPRGR